jgi:hypothetical protein
MLFLQFMLVPNSAKCVYGGVKRGWLICLSEVTEDRCLNLDPEEDRLHAIFLLVQLYHSLI